MLDFEITDNFNPKSINSFEILLTCTECDYITVYFKRSDILIEPTTVVKFICHICRKKMGIHLSKYEYYDKYGTIILLSEYFILGR